MPLEWHRHKIKQRVELKFMEEEKKQPEAITEWVESKEGFPQIYGNFFTNYWTLFDVSFQIGALIPKHSSTPNSGFVAEKRGVVTIAWPEAKAFLFTLAGLVDKYEKANGEI